MSLDSALALRPREAAKLLSVSQRTLWTWTQAGIVPHTRVGRTVLYSVDALRGWLSEQSSCSNRGAQND
jgi:excisionase family DNA binding protein